MTTPDGVDQSWSFLDPARAKAMGIKVVMMYLSDDPSKNATAAKIKAYHAVGIAVLLGWESDPGRPLLGAPAAQYDGPRAAAEYDQLIAQVGYRPETPAVIVFAMDRDTNPTQYPAIDAYFGTTKALLAGRYLNGVYAEADVCDHLSGAHLTDMEWETYAWSGGRISTAADFYQYLNGQNVAGASVDFDRIIHAADIGAWWPPGLAPLGGGTIEGDISMADAASLELQMTTLRQEILERFDGKTGVDLTSDTGSKSAVFPYLNRLCGPIENTAAVVAHGVITSGTADTATILAAIQALPAATIAALKAAL